MEWISVLPPKEIADTVQRRCGEKVTTTTTTTTTTTASLFHNGTHRPGNRFSIIEDSVYGSRGRKASQKTEK